MHKIFIRSFVSSLVLLFTLTVAAIAKDVKAAFVYIGPTGDHGWTYQHDAVSYTHLTLPTIYSV